MPYMDYLEIPSREETRKITFGFRTFKTIQRLRKTNCGQLPLFMVIREYWDRGEVYHARVIFEVPWFYPKGQFAFWKRRNWRLRFWKY